MASALTYIINGALTGLLYALIAMSFVIIYRSARVFNFAQGEIIVVGAFLIWTYMALLDLEWWIAVPLALASSLVLGLVIERMFLRPLVGEDLFSFVMVTIGLLILIRGVVLVAWGPEVRFFPAILPVAAARIGPIVIDQALLWGGLATLVIAALTSWFFNKTQLGLEMRIIRPRYRWASRSSAPWRSHGR
jgi:branched-chain amino acid transport system permease protein